jgi:transcriptional regulator with XRE-family HTH domain
MTITKTIIMEFENYMKKNNLTQAEAAEKIGCGREHLSKILRGLKNPSSKLLDAMEATMKE